MSLNLTADQFLAECVRSSLAAMPTPAWPPAWHSQADGEAVAARVEFHGIAVLLAQAAQGFAGWPVMVRERLQDDVRLTALWEEMHHAAITRLIAVLADAGVATLVMKGTALAYLYHDDPAARRRGDTDLLIHPHDLDRTRALFAANGCYRRDDPHGLFFQETWEVDCGAGMIHSVDLHWEPADRPILQQVLRSDEFWAASIPVPRLCAHARAPDPVVMLVHGAINQAWHVARGFFVDGERITGGRRLIWSVDYARIAAGFSAADWQRLVALCHDRQVSALIYDALTGAHVDIGFTAPPEPLAQLAGDTRLSPAAQYIAAPDRIGDMWADVRDATTLAVKARFIASMIFAPRSHLQDKYPRAAHWPTIALQLRRYGGALAWLRRRRRKP